MLALLMHLKHGFTTSQHIDFTADLTGTGNWSEESK